MRSFLKLLSILILTGLNVPWALGASAESADVVSAVGYPSLKPLQAGTLFTVAIEVKIKPGWHVNAREGLPEGFIPAELKLKPESPAGLVSTPRYPPAKKMSLAGMPQPFSVYEGTVVIYVDVRLPESVKEGVYKLPFQLTIQACNNQVCLAPADLSVQIPVEVVGLNHPVAPFHPELFQNVPAAQQAGPEDTIAGFLKDKGILLTFFLIFLGGLALNLTPCVYPMIPLTISYFGAQRADQPWVILARATAYLMGIAVTYSAMGVTAALTGRVLGSMLQSPYVLIGISLLLVALSLSMFGLYEIQAPGWLLNKATSGNTQGLFGAFGMGLVFGIVAAPCVNPFSVGLLTYVAAKADALLGFLMFFILALGLGFPYLWLGFFSSNIQRLPRSGMWMVWVKKVFGFILLGMPLYFLGPILPEGFNRIAVPAFLLLCGVLLGWVLSGTGMTVGFKRFQRAFGVFLVLAGLAAFKAWPEAVQLPFQDYSRQLLEQARAEKKPVFIDFSASWCLPCKELELNTFSDPQVHAALKDWVLLKADLTQYSSGPVEDLKKEYGILGVPTLLFIGQDGAEKKNLRVVGFLTVEEFLQRLRQVPD